MKKKMKFRIAGAIVLGFCVAVLGQGLRLTQPDEVGGSFTAVHQDNSTAPYNESSTSSGPGLEAFARYRISPSFCVSAGLGYYTAMDKTLSMDQYKMSFFPSLELKGIFMRVGKQNTLPFAFAGLHAFGWKSSVKIGGDTYSSDTYYDASLLIGAGIQVKTQENLSLFLSGDYRYTFTADGDPKPKFWVAKAGLVYALPKVSKAYKGGEELEYPADEQELALLDDLFKEETGTKEKKGDELSLLFQPETEETEEEKSLSSLFGEEESTSTAEATAEATYPDTEIGRLMAKVDQLKKTVDQKSKEISELKNKVEAHERALGTGVGAPLSDAEFKQRYESALNKFHMRLYREAISEFQALAASNPRHILASNCHYWTGECYNAMGQYRNALEAFQKVLTYRNSYKLDDALLMSGLCHLKLGNTQSARDQFQELLDRYPESEYAPKAMRYLGRL